nr:unnamed protein product [Callosobruchus chinensis]
MKNPKIILDKHEFLIYRKEPNQTVWICNNYFNKKPNDRCKVRLITFGRDVRMYGHHTHPAKLLDTSHLRSQRVTVVRHNSIGRTLDRLIAEEIDLGVDSKKDILETLAPLLSTQSVPSGTDSRYTRIISNQQKMLKNQNMILSALTRMHRSFREGLTKQHQEEVVIPQPGQATFATQQPTPLSRLFVPNPPSFEFKPISTREELDEFEKNLKDGDYLNTFAANMSANCWKSGRQLGLDVCYFLVDLLFTRRFMTTCSWTGK